MKNLLTWLVFLFLLSGSVSGQSMHELYKLDFKHFFEVGNHPVVVADYWNSIGISVAVELKKGKHLDWQDRDSIDQKLSKIFGEDIKTITLNQLTWRLKLPQATDKELREEFKAMTERAERVVEILGSEKAKSALLDKLFHSLTFARYKEHYLIHIDEPALAIQLGLSEQQQQKIASIKKQVAHEFRNSSTLARATIRIELDKAWEELLQFLTAEEAKKVETIVGQPTDWYIQFGQLRRRQPFQSHAPIHSIPYCVWGSELPTKPDIDGKYVDQYSDEKLAAAGFTRIDKFLVELLEWETCRKTLELDELQIEQLDQALAYYRRRAILETVNDDSRRLKLKNAQPIAYPDAISKILNDQQLATLRWIEFQANPKIAGNFIRASVELFPRDHPARGLELFKPLRKPFRSLYSINGMPQGFKPFRTRTPPNYRYKIESAADQFQNEKADALNSMSNQIQDVLTDEQKKKYLRLLDPKARRNEKMTRLPTIPVHPQLSKTG